ncbi:MAG: lipopolysaccharide heptosyltransferase family protein [Caldimicrobium sp.]|jgi:ADP-heptose:LPS heptosyltransferase|nr:lipopolysaccharide heptosyltransferase family protein [Caldimicrobium sp.]
MASKGKVLVYRRGAIGDTLLTFPLFEALKKEGYTVYAVGNTDVLPLAKLSGFVDKFYTELYPSLLEETFERKIFISKEGTIKPFPKERIWLPYYYLKALSLPLEFSKKLKIPETFLKEDFKDYVVIHPGSGSPLKNPPFSLFARVKGFLEGKGYKVLFLAGPYETLLLKSGIPCYYTEDLTDLALKLAKARAFIGNDSGITHLASYLGVQTFAIFGPSDEVIFQPIGEKVHIISLDLPCRPCFPKVCRERRCLKEDELFEKFISLGIF